MTDTIERTAQAHSESHHREHEMTQTAVTKAEESMTARLEGMNEWREESKARMETYPTKNEIGEVVKRLEETISRLAADRIKDNERDNERLTKVETFVISSQAQMGTLRALVVLVPIIFGIVAFVLARFGL